MPLPSSGQITLDEMHVEAGGSTTTEGAVNDADIRSLIGAASGGPNLAFTDWYGASGAVPITINITISSNTNNYNLWNSKGGTYSAGNTTVNVTINSGVIIGSTSTGTYAFDTGTGWSSGDVINITNNGTIKGRGGNGSDGSSIINPSQPSQYATTPSSGGTGGPAFRGQFACTVTNNGSVYGGGGGGGGGGGRYYFSRGKIDLYLNDKGNGGGGGAGVNGGTGGAAGLGGLGQAIDGSNGTATAGGAGGAVGNGGVGGNGGGLGSNGATGTTPALTADNPRGNTPGGTGGTRGYYQVGSSLINGGSGIGGTVGGRSA
jgi:hypothetical protein